MGEYDLVVSLGGNCSAAAQLKHRGLRPFVMPFDWLLMRDTHPIEFLATAFANRFVDFALRENLSEYEAATKEHGVEVRHCIDSKSGFRLIHHLHGPISSAAYEEFHGQFQRRLARLYAHLRISRRVLFLLSTGFVYDERLLVPVKKGLEEVFPGVEIELLAMQFDADRPAEFSVDGVRVMRIARKIDFVYDIQCTGAEWKCLDSVKLRGADTFAQKRKRFPLKWLYKLWMSLGRRLERAGLGCANMRFAQNADQKLSARA